MELQQLDARQRRAHRQGVPRPDAQLLPLPRPQVRPDHAGGVLPLPGGLRAAGAPPRPLAGRAGPGRRTRSTATGPRTSRSPPAWSGCSTRSSTRRRSSTPAATSGTWSKDRAAGPARRAGGPGRQRSRSSRSTLPPESWYPGLKAFVRAGGDGEARSRRSRRRDARRWRRPMVGAATCRPVLRREAAAARAARVGPRRR